MKNLDTSQSNEIYCHRGFWNEMANQNSLKSFLDAESYGFSIETDIRSFQGEAVICHDLPTKLKLPSLKSLTKLKSAFALNIKEDGLQENFNQVRKWIETSNSFVFDGSIPEMYKYRVLGIEHALRMSEFEKTIPWRSGYIWLDSFLEDWWLKDNSAHNAFQDSKVVVVSPELHGRDPRFVWDFLADERLKGRFHFSICTDRPLEYLSWR